MKSCPQCAATYPDEYSVCPKDGTRLTGSTLWEPNSIIRGKYKILARVGEGGMATVYRAHHLLLDETRALKVISSELARDEQFVQRFKNEAINTRKLQHPNAVRVDDLDIAEDGRPFIAMEMVEGESLKSFILRAGPLRVSQILDIALQVCEALEAAHALGLIHRDIKPDNIFLVPRREPTPLVKILDFGIARLKEGAPGAARPGVTLTGTGVVIGTPEYMSPEQAMGKHGEQLDGRSDLYSLGIVMYRMLTGELPFKADTTVEMILHHIQTIPKPPQALKPQLGIPAYVSAIVMKVLEKDREKRFASAAAMAEVLRQAQEQLLGKVGAVGLGRWPAPPQPAAPRPASAWPQNLRESAPLRAAPEMRPPQAAPFQPSPPGEKKELPWRQVLLGIVILAVVVIGIRGLKRQEPAPPQPVTSTPAAGTASTSTPEPAPAPTPAATSEPFAPSPTPAPISPAPPPGPGPRPVGEVGPPARQIQPPPPEPGMEFPPGPAPAPMEEAAQGETPNRDLEPGLDQTEIGPGPQRREIRQLAEEGRQHFRLGEYGQAAQAFRRILEIDPNNQRARIAFQKCIERMREGREPRRP